MSSVPDERTRLFIGDSLQYYLGDFSDPGLALWSCENFQLLSSVDPSGPIHDAAFSPSAASQMACVGSQGVYFCLIHTRGPEVDLKVNDNRTTLMITTQDLMAILTVSFN